jgi:hypothetical protein
VRAGAACWSGRKARWFQGINTPAVMIEA